MATQQREKRPAFAPSTVTTDKRRAGKTIASDTPVEIRGGGQAIDDALRAHIHERMGRQLGKFATQIERVIVRFGDENGTRGGVDKTCMIQVLLSALPTVVAEERGENERKAFDLAMATVERATRKNMQRHGFSTRIVPSAGAEEEAEEAEGAAPPEPQPRQSLIGRTVGHARQNLLDALARPDPGRAAVDTAAPGQSASDRKVGKGHTATRNTKLNTAGMSYALEDSTSDRPSRKSTRRAKNRVKSDSNLTLRTIKEVRSPKQRALRHTTHT